MDKGSGKLRTAWFMPPAASVNACLLLNDVPQLVLTGCCAPAYVSPMLSHCLAVSFPKHGHVFASETAPHGVDTSVWPQHRPLGRTCSRRPQAHSHLACHRRPALHQLMHQTQPRNRDRPLCMRHGNQKCHHHKDGSSTDLLGKAPRMARHSMDCLQGTQHGMTCSTLGRGGGSRRRSNSSTAAAGAPRSTARSRCSCRGMRGCRRGKARCSTVRQGGTAESPRRRSTARRWGMLRGSLATPKGTGECSRGLLAGMPLWAAGMARHSTDFQGDS